MEKIQASSRLILNDLDCVFDFQKNFGVYRNLQQEVEPPLIPFFGLVMKDMAVFKETRPIMSTHLYNFERSWEIYDHLKILSHLQSCAYSFGELDPLLASYCQLLPCDSDVQLRENSTRNEPELEDEPDDTFLTSLWKNAGESVQLAILKMHESRANTPIDRLRKPRLFKSTKSLKEAVGGLFNAVNVDES